MKTLYLMCGNSFSGKSTLAAAMVEKLGCLKISLDEINRERGLGFGGEGLPVEEWERTHRIALERLEQAMPSGRDIVLDDTNCFRWLRDRFRSIAVRHGYDTVIIYFDFPLSVLQERRRQNESTQTRPGVKEEIFLELARQFEIPAPDEPALRFGSDDTVDDWINSHLKRGGS